MTSSDATMTSVFDVAIVGFGPTGAALANLLGLCGLSVGVFEREATVLDLPRAVHFDGEVMRIFQAMGLADVLAPRVRASGGIKYFNVAGEMLMERKPVTAIGRHGWPDNVLFHQPELEATLREGLERFPKVHVALGTQVECVEDQGDTVVLQLCDRSSGIQRSVKADWLIGCDGGRSSVRETIGGGMDDLGLHQPWLVVDVLLTHEVDLPELTIQYCDPDRPVTYVRGVGRRRRWEIMLMPGDDPQTIIEPESIWRLLKRWVTPENATLERRAVYTFHSLIARQWRHGRLLIAGDAAHQTPPFLGQGLCAGIRDAANLSWKLASVCRGADPAILDTYANERIPHVTQFISTAVELAAIIQTTDPVVAAERDQRMLSGEPAEMINLSPQLGPGIHDMREPGGTISDQPRLSDGVLLDDAIGQRFALIGPLPPRGPHTRSLWTLIDAGDITCIHDPALSPWLASMGATWLILRPDRYILGHANSVEKLEHVATRWLDVLMVNQQANLQTQYQEGA